MKRKRDEITEMYYPKKVSIEQFVGILQRSFDNFTANMCDLGLKERYPEEWMKFFVYWSEMAWKGRK